MIPMVPGTKVYLACHPVSMRLGFDGLAARVAQVLDGDPFLCVGLYYVAARPRAVDSAHFCRPLPPHNVQTSRNSCYTAHLSLKRAARLSEFAALHTVMRKT